MKKFTQQDRHGENFWGRLHPERSHAEHLMGKDKVHALDSSREWEGFKTWIKCLYSGKKHNSCIITKEITNRQLRLELGR